MKVNCVSCGHNMMLDDAYDDFEGLFKCWVCGTLLQIKTLDGKIKSVNLMGTQLPASGDKDRGRPRGHSLNRPTSDSALGG